MSFYKVEEVLDAITIRVSPKWTFKGVEGDIVKIYGYDNPETEEGRDSIKGLISNFLLGRFVELKGAHLSNPNNPVTCHVFRDAIDVARLVLAK